MVEQLSDLPKTEVDPIDLSVSHRLRKQNQHIIIIEIVTQALPLGISA